MNVFRRRPSGRHTRPLPHPLDVPVMSAPPKPRRIGGLTRIVVLALAVLTVTGAFLGTRLSFSSSPASATARTAASTPATPAAKAKQPALTAAQLRTQLGQVRRQITATRKALAQLPHLATLVAKTGSAQTNTGRLETELQAHLTQLRTVELTLAKRIGTVASTRTPAPTQAATPGTASVPAVVAYARAQLGKPYRWGATGPDAFDCSGLVMRAWQAAGVTLPRTTGDQANAGTRITRDQLQPGDLIFTNGFGHVQLYIGNEQVIQARHTGTLVEITDWPDDQVVNAYVHVA